MTHEGGIETSPASCEISPRSSANRLDLPLPLAPISPTLCPGCTVSDAPLSNVVVPRESVRLEIRSMSFDLIVVVDDKRCVIGKAAVGVNGSASREGGNARRCG